MPPVISGRVPDAGVYLLVDSDLEAGEPPPAETPARVLDTRAGVLHPPMYFQSITAHVPRLEPYDADEGELEALLAGVEVRGPPETEIGEVTAGDGDRVFEDQDGE